MRVIALLSLLAVCSIAWPADDQAYLGIFAETYVMKMPGMPGMADIPKEMLDKIPNAEMLMGKAQRVLDVRLWSPGLAPMDATAWLAPPDGLKQGPRLDLDLFRPQPIKPGEETIPTSIFMAESGGMVVICAGTTGYGSTVDLRYLWMRQKRFQGSHFANDEQAAAFNQLVIDGHVNPCLGEVFTFDRIGDAHQLMSDNKHGEGKMVALVGAKTKGTKDLPA